ncbi:MAG TPA: lipoprotein insertase outer membrane protein LolB [Gammaproteobacteria bacterium]|nr:lipoprotein insertase outer membrane protein LolB [Gammaproteobacteria bacterium]
MTFIIKHFLLATVLAFVLTSCTTIAPSPPTNVVTPPPVTKNQQVQLEQLRTWHIKGKIAIQTAQDAGSAVVDWQQKGSHYAISLANPLGGAILKLTGEPGVVTLVTADGKAFTADSPEQLLAKQWGFHLPVSNLTYWIRGLPVPQIEHSSQFDARHRLQKLVQQGFVVEFLSYEQIGELDLPSKIKITSSALKIKLVIYSWQLPVYSY